MTATQLIAKLRELVKEHGDMEVSYGRHWEPTECVTIVDIADDVTPWINIK